jgi:hypothetical protein
MVMNIAQNANARTNAQREREALARTRRIDIEERRAQRLAVNEQKIAQDHNKTALTDIKIEREQAALELARLKLIEQREKMRLNAPTFVPDDYTSDPQPVTPITPTEFKPENYS